MRDPQLLSGFGLGSRSAWQSQRLVDWDRSLARSESAIRSSAISGVVSILYGSSCASYEAGILSMGALPEPSTRMTGRTRNTGRAVSVSTSRVTVSAARVLRTAGASNLEDARRVVVDADVTVDTVRAPFLQFRRMTQTHVA